MSKRDYFVAKIVKTLKTIWDTGRGVNNDHLILEVMKQAEVSRRTAREYIKLAKTFLSEKDKQQLL